MADRTSADLRDTRPYGVLADGRFGELSEMRGWYGPEAVTPLAIAPPQSHVVSVLTNLCPFRARVHWAPSEAVQLLCDAYFLDLLRDHRADSAANRRSWLWFTCPMGLRSHVAESLERFGLTSGWDLVHQ